MTGGPDATLCRSCGEVQVVPILWGMPGPDDAPAPTSSSVGAS